MKKPNKLILRCSSLRPLTDGQLASVQGGTFIIYCTSITQIQSLNAPNTKSVLFCG